jgi:multiple sugar transport system substrate-binding protein
MTRSSNNLYTRREALSTGAKVAIGVVGAAIIGGAAYVLYQQTAVPQKVKLEFTVWNYSVETIRDNIQKFMQQYPNIEVVLYDFNWPDYPSTMVQRFTTKTPTDVCYNGEDWLAQWAEAGWVVPLQDYWDKYTVKKKFNEYVNDMVPFARESMTYKGKIYGLPYYSDMFTFMYNDKILKDNGLEVPETWEDVLDASLKLKEKGIKYPYILQYQATNPFDFYAVFSGAMGRGARLFDEDLNPIFASEDHPFYEHLQWIVDGIHKYKIINPDYLATHETDAAKKMGAGEGAFTVLAKYMLAAMNAPGSSPNAGNFRLALMPGKTHEAYGFAKMYNMTRMCVDRGDAAIQAAITFIEYFGANDSPVLKRWAVEKGLGFGFLSPYSDPDIAKSLVEYYGPGVDKSIKEQAAIAKTIPHPVWFGQWVDYSIKEAISKAFANEISVKEAVDRMAKRAKELRG